MYIYIHIDMCVYIYMYMYMYIYIYIYVCMYNIMLYIYISFALGIEWMDPDRSFLFVVARSYMDHLMESFVRDFEYPLVN